MDINNFLPSVKRNIPLKNHTAFRIGGPARYFFEAKSKDDLLLALKMAKRFNLPFFNSRVKRGSQSSRRAKRGGVFILGGGSNLLVSDKGYKGLVIKMMNDDYRILKNEIIAGAGILLGRLVIVATEHGLSGLEWSFGIPGTVGGAIFGNAGAFGKSMKNVIRKVEVFNAKNLKFETYNLKDCRFDYRESVFKKKKNLIIVSVFLKLKKGKKSEIKKRMEKNIDYKKSNQPLNYPSAGSVFKNPDKKSAAKLIEDCGLKGKKIGKAKISWKHANFIVNLGGARAENVKNLINFTKKAVKKRFGVSLKEEIQYLGFEN